MTKPQNEAQFKMLHGNEERWAATTKAGFEVLFRNPDRAAACDEFGITKQALHAFIGRNLVKHHKKIEQLNSSTEYMALGK